MARLAPALRPLAVLVLVAVLAAVAWSFFATPPRIEFTDRGLGFGAGQAERRFGVMVTYLLIGAIGGLVWGAWATRVLGDLFGPFVVGVYIVVLTGAGAAVDYLGRWLGPDDPRELAVEDLTVGDTFRDALVLDGPVFWLVWPICGLTALVVVLYWRAEPAPA